MLRWKFSKARQLKSHNRLACCGGCVVSHFHTTVWHAAVVVWCRTFTHPFGMLRWLCGVVLSHNRLACCGGCVVSYFHITVWHAAVVVWCRTSTHPFGMLRWLCVVVIPCRKFILKSLWLHAPGC